MPDDRLVEAARNGDEKAFAELVRRYESKVAATVIGMLGPGPEAEDIGQEVFIRFYQGLAKFRGDASLGTFLTRIAINLSINAFRRRRRQRLLFWDRPRETLREQTSSDSNDLHEILEKALGRLSPKFRSVVVLRLIEGYSTRETAELLNIQEGTVLSRLARARKKLQAYLAPWIGDVYETEDSRAAASIG